MLGWALNEERNIGRYIEQAEELLRQITDDFELIIVDDGSSDGTWKIAHGYQKTRPWLRLFKNERNRGPGYNIKLTVSHAQKDYLFWETVDWSYDVSCLPRMLPLLREFDILQGVRVRYGSLGELFRTRSDTPYKAGISLVNYLVIRLLFGLPVADYQNVTVYPRELVQRVTIETESAFTNPECLIKCWWLGASIKEIPVPFLKRQVGTATGTRPKAVAAALRDIFSWWLRWVVFGRRQLAGKGTVTHWSEAQPAP